MGARSSPLTCWQRPSLESAFVLRQGPEVPAKYRFACLLFCLDKRQRTPSVGFCVGLKLCDGLKVFRTRRGGLSSGALSTAPAASLDMACSSGARAIIQK